MNVTPREEAEQEAVAAWLDLHSLAWFHVPNEGKKSVSYHAKMKRQGLKSGVPDIIIITPPPLFPDSRGTAIELKRTKGSTVSPEQRAWLANLEFYGWKAACCKGAGVAINYLESLGYGRPTRRI